MKKTLLLTALLSLNLIAADADYQTQQDSADKAFNELDGKESDGKDLELQKKELEIERLKLELEKKKLAEEKQKAQQPAPAQQTYQAPSRPVQQYESDFYIGLETYSATGTRTNKYTDSSGWTAEATADIDFTQRALKIGFGKLGENRLTIDLTSGRDITDSTSGDSYYKEGTGVGLTWDIVMSSMYKSASASNLLPFLRLGFGIGTYEYLDEYKYLYAEDTVSTVEFKWGIGVYYQINKTFELSASYDSQTAALAYENASGDKWEITDQVGGVAIGFNVHF